MSGMMRNDSDENLFEETLPADPCALAGEWFDLAREHSGRKHWNAFMLATADAEARPSVRTLLMKDFDRATGALTFYTNYHSRKAREMEANPHVAIVFHWDALQRQIRMEGAIEKAPAEVSDAYFATRPRESQIGAWASDQSTELEGWEALLEQVMHYAMQFPSNEPVPRPPFWGGYVFTPEVFEFWHGRTGRVHERVMYRKDAPATDEAPEAAWRAVWLNP